MRRFWIVSSIAACLLGASVGHAGENSGAPTTHPPDLRAAAEPGAFCTPQSCRPLPASPWSGAAFGAAVIAMGWQSRRRPATSA